MKAEYDFSKGERGQFYRLNDWLRNNIKLIESAKEPVDIQEALHHHVADN